MTYVYSTRKFVLREEKSDTDDWFAEIIYGSKPDLCAEPRVVAQAAQGGARIDIRDFSDLCSVPL